VLVPKRSVILAPDAARQFKRLSAAERSRLKRAMEASLADDDATIASRNRFRLRRASERTGFEFRDGDLRVFYCVVGDEVRVTLIGRKKANQLFIDGQRFSL
jgi:mRNA-degrading endonuclease RelE of RelBE toxin-antitoxin system